MPKRRTPEWEKNQDKIIDEYMAKWEKANADNSAIARAKIDEILKKKGIDGIIMENDEGSFGRKTKTFIAIDPTQIKSIFNRGKFDPKKADILSQNKIRPYQQEMRMRT